MNRLARRDAHTHRAWCGPAPLIQTTQDPEASTNGQVLEALLDVADSFPEVIAALERERPHDLSPETSPLPLKDARDLISDLSAALDNVLLYHGGAMPSGDAMARRQLVERAKAFLLR